MIPPVVKQTWIVLSVLANSVNQGMILSYPSCLIPALMANDSPIKIDLNIASWLASIMAIVMIFGLLMSSILMDLLGRRLSNLIAILPGIIGSLLIYYASNVTSLMIGRLLGGISNIAGYGIGCCVMGEYTTPRYRGIFLNLKTATFCVGATIMHIIGGYYDWRTISLLNNIPLIVAFIISCTWTESPSWLAWKGEFKKSEEVFFWLRGTNDESVREFEAMVRVQKERLASTKKRTSFMKKMEIFFKKFSDRTFILPICLQLSATMLLEAGGRHIFPVYASTIMGDIFHDHSKSFMYTICIDIVTAAGCSTSCVITNYFKRRTILFSSAISCMVLLIIISTYGFLINGGIAADKPWAMAIMLIIFYSLANFGITTMPLVLFGELFPLEHRGTCVAVAGTLSSIILFGVLKVTPYLLVTIGVYGVFLVLAGFMIISIIHLYIELPETSNKTLQEIEEYFRHGKFLDKPSDENDDDANSVMVNGDN